MIDSVSHFLDTALAVILGVIGWIIKRLLERLDLGDKRMTKIEVELATQRERDTAVENRMSGLEASVKEINTKLDRVMEFNEKMSLYENINRRKSWASAVLKVNHRVSEVILEYEAGFLKRKRRMAKGVSL